MECFDLLLPHITSILNDSLALGTFPSDFKNSLVVPLLKKKSLDQNILKNYRPVSNLSFISKILERVVFNQFINHLQKNNLIEPFQSAYKAGHSTETALLRVVNDLFSSVDNGNVSMLTMLDLSAAFDTLDHEIVFHRLSFSFGINGKVLSWIKSYLQCRKQKVKLDSFYSQNLDLLYGVPQGSVLGPLLFSMYVFPIKDVIYKDLFSYHLYADDTQLYSNFKPSEIDNVLSIVSNCTHDVNNWMRDNYLKMNNDKTELLLCGTSQKLNTVDVNNVLIGDELIYFSKTVKNLGVTLDQTLSLNTHVSTVRKSCYFVIRNISKFRSFINHKATVQLVVSLVLSKLDYCNSLFFNMSNDNFNKLQTIQNHAARVVTKAHKRSSALPILKELHWLPIRQRVDYKISIMVFKCLNQSDFPSYLKDLISIYTPTRELRSSSDRFLLVKPFMRLATFGQRSFHYAAPTVWNALPYEIRSLKNLQIFKTKLKTHYFKIAFD